MKPFSLVVLGALLFTSNCFALDDTLFKVIPNLHEVLGDGYYRPTTNTIWFSTLNARVPKRLERFDRAEEFCARFGTHVTSENDFRELLEEASKLPKLENPFDRMFQLGLPHFPGRFYWISTPISNPDDALVFSGSYGTISRFKKFRVASFFCVLRLNSYL